MKSQLHLYTNLREKLKDEIKLIVDIYTNRLSPVFGNIEKEAEEKSDEYYNSVANADWDFEKDPFDLSLVAEDAFEIGLNYYEKISLMRYNNLSAWLTILYQFWEQQVRLFLFEEERHYYVIDFKDFCSNGIKDIKKEFMNHNENIEKLSSWSKINELRLLCNTIKHGDGGSAEDLRKLLPNIFHRVEFPSGDMLDLYKTTLNNEVLNISDDFIVRYGTCLLSFWDELPERMYSNDY